MKIKYGNTVLNVSFWSFTWRLFVMIPCIIYLIFIELPLILISMIFNYLSLMAICREYYENNSFKQLIVDYIETIGGICNWYIEHTTRKISKNK